jgi:6-bladed beta-propeller
LTGTRLFAPFCFVIGLTFGVYPAEAPETSLQIKLEKPLEIGRKELLFGSIASVCEDAELNFYVLDGREQRVFKFSPDGRLLAKFGQKGQGPGDFQSPGQVVFTSQGELAVLEDLYYVSFFKTDGTFIRRLDLNGRLGLGFIGPDRFYGWIWRPEDQQQLMVDSKNNVLKAFHTIARDLFSVNLPDETGRAVMFNYSDDSYVPQFLYGHNSDLSAVGISDRYEISLLDETGQSVGAIVRDIKPQKFSAKEKDYLDRELREFAKSKGWPGRVARELAKKIPSFKNMIGAVRVSPEDIFVFRIPNDITAESGLLPVDIFSRRGEYIGTGQLPDIPVFISGGAIYFSPAEPDGNIYLLRQAYSLKR